MKFNCDRFFDWLDYKIDDYLARRREWHWWFAWYPIKLKHGDCRWLERIGRRKSIIEGPYFFFSVYHYRSSEIQREAERTLSKE